MYESLSWRLEPRTLPLTPHKHLYLWSNYCTKGTRWYFPAYLIYILLLYIFILLPTIFFLCLLIFFFLLFSSPPSLSHKATWSKRMAASCPFRPVLTAVSVGINCISLFWRPFQSKSAVSAPVSAGIQPNWHKSGKIRGWISVLDAERCFGTNPMWLQQS